MTMRLNVGPGGTELIVREETPASKRSAFRPTIASVSGEVDGLELRRAVEALRQALEAGAAPDPAGMEKELGQAVADRQRFWADACCDSGTGKPLFKAAGELRRKYGWRLCTPSPEQVQFILDLLDATFPAWDRERPAYFFDKLETHFPHLQKYRAGFRT